MAHAGPECNAGFVSGMGEISEPDASIAQTLNLTAGGSSGGEGALLRIGGSYAGIGSDIGGSIRSPATNQGVFGLRPTSLRLSLQGFVAAASGAEHVMPVVGPLSTSLPMIHLFMKSIIDMEPWRSDATLAPPPWKTIKPIPSNAAGQKLRVDILTDGGVVKPHPPILRALALVRKALKELGRFDVVQSPP
ncbi:hypothetical protein Q7P37_009698 [Cladosporium fusiforme]